MPEKLNNSMTEADKADFDLESTAASVEKDGKMMKKLGDASELLHGINIEPSVGKSELDKSIRARREESDRRVREAMERISEGYVRLEEELEEELERLANTRKTMRAARDRSGLKKIAIVGYTNAGKSTLLNTLTDAGILAEDKLFATLDPTTRKFTLPGGETVLLTDTVGFIKKLPHHLVKAFRSTLDEAVY